MELIVGNDMVERLWVRTKGQTNIKDVIVRVYYRPHRQDDNTNEFFFEEQRDTPKSNALVLMKDFNLTEINWKYHTASTIWSRRYLQNLDDSFMEQVLREPTWKDALLDLLLVSRVDLMSKVETGGCLGHSDHKGLKLKISVDKRKSASREGKAKKEGASPVEARSSDMGYRGATCHCREKIPTAKAELELKLPEVWGTIKGVFFKYINGNRQYRNIICLLQDGNGHLTHRDRDKAEVFNAFFASLFNMDDRKGVSIL
ncbi:hypothetical protein BTVI_03224 [Pitangus sulphuratus]|nr:hypothetical protein BTVI_03224 [Pitangus sulphuratus]